MAGQLTARRLSPIPPSRSPSPNSAAGQEAPRPSVSSARSMKRSEADFEAALRAQNTVFLRASTEVECTTAGVKGTEDAPVPVEKRSYEDDLRCFARGSDKTGAGAAEAEIGVIPPTPSPKKAMIGRRDSGRQGQQGEGNPRRSSMSSPKGQSVGLDAELNESQRVGEQKSSSGKRRSIFRAANTASSPDLASRARTLKDHSLGTTTPASSAQNTKMSQLGHKNRHAPPPPSFTLGSASGSNGRLNSTGKIGGPGSRSVSGATVSSVAASDNGWDRLSDAKGMSPQKMATVSERHEGKVGPSQNPTDRQSLRNRAKGVFGRMFGTASSSRDHLPSTVGSGSTTRQGLHESSQPPIPPVPTLHQRSCDGRRRSASSPSGALIPAKRSPTPTAESSRQDGQEEVVISSDDEVFETPLEGRQSITPTGRRPSEYGLPSPSRAVGDEDEDGQKHRRNGTGHGILHRRQLAENGDQMFDSQSRPKQLSPVKKTASFSDDVAGIFDSIGQTDPAKELGLPMDSLRLPTAEGAPSRARFPLELGRARSNEGPGSSSTQLAVPVPVPITERTSSLPITGSPRPDGSYSGLSRNTSSPSPRPAFANNLFHPPGPHREAYQGADGTVRHHADPPALAPHADLSDFGPALDSGDITIKNRHSADLPPPSPTSVRLVTTAPKPDLVNGLFMTSGPWGSSSPSSQPATPSSNQDEQPSSEPARTPVQEGEDADEERGRRLACEFLDDDFSSVPSDKVAEFLGGPRRVNAVALRYYMSYFDMKGQTLVESFRDLCAKLHLRAESQEIDRIIEGFSARYYDCNPSTVFGSPGVVHTVTGAMLMLNTDLHIADLSKHMSRADFVRNAMRAIQESVPLTAEADTPKLSRVESSTSRLASSVSLASRPGTASPTQRSASAPVMIGAQARHEADHSTSATPQTTGGTRSSSTSSFPRPKQWESEAETALKDIFNQVRADRILLPTGSSAPSSNCHSVVSLGSENRNSTLRSPSGRSNDRVNALKRGSIRGMQGLMSNAFAASDGRLSPTPSYATSLGDNRSHAMTIGFASNLSHTVIKEHDDEKDSVDSHSSSGTTDDDLNDDELALLGAPWAKEGLLWKRSGHEGSLRKTTKKDWKQFFVVVQMGELLMFTFGQGSESGSFGAVGGGNWLNNANAAGRYSLVHTSTVTVKGGYAKDRPFVFAVKLPSNEVLYLQAGTDDLVTEWVQTCNYWSARRTRQPLQAGVSNVEYGWNRVSDYMYLKDTEDDRSSLMSSRSKFSNYNGSPHGRGPTSTPADRIHIVDWKPPQPSLMPSPLDEENQVDALAGYVKTLTDDLEQHRVLHDAVLKLYTPHSKNATKATANWTMKHNWLVAELALYRGYVDTLHEAIALRIRKQGERKLEKSLARSMTSFHRRESADERGKHGGKGSGRVEEDGPAGTGDEVEELEATPRKAKR